MRLPRLNGAQGCVAKQHRPPRLETIEVVAPHFVSVVMPILYSVKVARETSGVVWLLNRQYLRLVLLWHRTQRQHTHLNVT